MSIDALRECANTCQCYICRAGRGHHVEPKWVTDWVDRFMREALRNDRVAQRRHREEAYQARIQKRPRSWWRRWFGIEETA